MNYKPKLALILIALALFAAGVFLFFPRGKLAVIQPLPAQSLGPLGNAGIHSSGQSLGKTEPHTDNPAPAKAEGTIVKFKSEVAKTNFLAQNKLSDNDLTYYPQLNSYSINKLQNELKTTEGASLAPNYTYHVDVVPNDPSYGQQYALPNIAAPGGWDINTGSSSVTVAVLDTGFAVSHQDLTNKWALNAGEMGAVGSEGAAPNCTSRGLPLDKSCNNLDNDGDGYKSNWRGWDFYSNNNDVSAGQTSPSSSAAYHGTETSSLVGAQTNNAVGIAGVCWACKVLPVQVLGDGGSGSTADVASGIYYATDHGAKVINMSLGTSSFDQTMLDAVNYAISHNVVVVASAGNDGAGATPNYPAAYSGVVAVAAVDSTDTIASFSNTGSYIAVSAPGVSIYGATWSQANQTSLYGSHSGTSFSAPIVAGQVGLMRSLNGTLNVSTIGNIVKNTADKVAGMGGQSFSTSYGYGRVNVQKALAYIAGSGWQFESFDGSSNSLNSDSAVLGGTPNTTTFNSNLYTFYYDNTLGALRMASNGGSGWSFSVLDGQTGVAGSSNNNVGLSAKAFSFNNKLHVFYYDKTAGDLRHASSSDGTSWSFETLDGAGGANGRINANVGGQPSVTQQGGVVHVLYYDNTNGSLRHASSSDGTNWSFETLDGTGSVGGAGRTTANVGQTPSITSYGSGLQAFYYDATNGNLRHAWNDGSWHFENLDGDPGSIAHSDANLGITPTAMSYNNTLQLFYYDNQNGNLRHGWADNTGWHFENLDGDPGSIAGLDSNVGVNTSFTSFGSTLQLYYYDSSNARLRHGWADGSGWHFENLDGALPSVGQNTANMGYYSTATVFNNTLELFYTDASNGDLRHAWTK